MTLSDYIFSTYNALLDAGWRMHEIDQMDMIGYMKVRAWKARKEAEPKPAYIDEVWPSLRPR
ncbi:MAG: hypothetical protein E7321_05290 [Clostridiales bacterium]|nr:hypothetical protein [Clostridiales bacterium]